MIYKTLLQHEALRPYIKEYFIAHFDFRDLAQIPTKLLPPRPEQSIIFYPTAPFTKVNPQLDQIHHIPQTIIQGQLLTHWYHHYPSNFKFVKIIFQPSGLYHLLEKMPLTNFTDIALDAESVMGKEATSIIQQLMNTEQYMEMIRVVDTYLLQKLRKINIQIESIDKITPYLVSPYNPYTLDYLANQSCLSLRQFERKFRERVGISPKLFTRIVRFNRAFEMKEKHPSKDWLAIALTCGYSDYQHMVKDFKQFAGVTPIIMMQEND